MDRTNWKYGRKDINFLVISVVVGNVSIPIVWKLLPKKVKRGNSNTAQRKAITSRLLKIMSARDIYVLTMDREFDGTQWLRWLDAKGIAYIVRIKSNITIGGKGPASKVKGRHYKLKERQDVFGLRVFFSRKRLTKGGRSEHLLLISNHFYGKEALDLYKIRWGIERLFWHVKQKGFDLEATHMTEACKLDKLFAAIALAFLFSFAWGCELRQKETHTTVHIKRKSIFRVGLENILRMLNSNQSTHSQVFRKRRRELQRFKQWLLSGSTDCIFLV